MNKKIIIVAILIIALLLVGCSSNGAAVFEPSVNKPANTDTLPDTINGADTVAVAYLAQYELYAESVENPVSYNVWYDIAINGNGGKELTIVSYNFDYLTTDYIYYTVLLSNETQSSFYINNTNTLIDNVCTEHTYVLSYAHRAESNHCIEYAYRRCKTCNYIDTDLIQVNYCHAYAYAWLSTKISESTDICHENYLFRHCTDCGYIFTNDLVQYEHEYSNEAFKNISRDLINSYSINSTAVVVEPVCKYCRKAKELSYTIYEIKSDVASFRVYDYSDSIIVINNTENKTISSLTTSKAEYTYDKDTDAELKNILTMLLAITEGDIEISSVIYNED